MKTRMTIAAATLFAGVAALGLAYAAPAGGMTTILDGKSMNGWTPIGEANWRVANGDVEADKGKGGFLVSKDTYGDFQLRAEVWVDDDANSGIFIRCSDPKNIGGMTCYEVNIFDKRPGPEYGTGAIVNVGKVDPMPHAGGKWNVMEIEAKGPVMSVTFNGIRTVNAVSDSKHASGVLGLQYGAGIVKFRKVEIKKL